jgi:hypothetical protein
MAACPPSTRAPPSAGLRVGTRAIATCAAGHSTAVVTRSLVWLSFETSATQPPIPAVQLQAT